MLGFKFEFLLIPDSWIAIETQIKILDPYSKLSLIFVNVVLSKLLNFLSSLFKNKASTSKHKNIFCYSLNIACIVLSIFLRDFLKISTNFTKKYFPQLQNSFHCVLSDCKFAKSFPCQKCVMTNEWVTKVFSCQVHIIIIHRQLHKVIAWNEILDQKLTILHNNYYIS